MYCIIENLIPTIIYYNKNLRVFDVYVLILLNILLKNICMAILQSIYRNADVIRVIIYFILFFCFQNNVVYVVPAEGVEV